MGLLNPLGYDVDFLSHEDRGTMTGVLNTVLLQNKSSGRGKYRQISGIEKAKENLKRGRLDGKDMKALIENAADRMAVGRVVACAAFRRAYLVDEDRLRA